MMTCPFCNEPMIYGGDHDDEDADGVELITSNHHCNDCSCYILVSIPAASND